MIIESNRQIVDKNAALVFQFLSNLNNYRKLFPEDKIENWDATEDSCTCKIKGLSDIGLKRVATTPNTLIYLDSHGKSPIKFTLNIYLSEVNENQTEVYLIFEGSSINPFMKMMLEKPLTNFFNDFVSQVNNVKIS
ncbi:MAG: hypothetical protein J5I47_05265 [Vicingus serpentipes]|nr:hypothetical protein [Vicingus serpentipes]